MPSKCVVSIICWTSLERTTCPTRTCLGRAGVTSMATLLKQRCLYLFSHLCHMVDGRIPKDLLYSETVSGKRPPGHPQLHIKDMCKWDLKATDINTNTWEAFTQDRKHLEGDGKDWSHLLWREAAAPQRREAAPQKGQMQDWQARCSLYLWSMPKILSFLCGTI